MFTFCFVFACDGQCCFGETNYILWSGFHFIVSRAVHILFSFLQKQKKDS